jgi:1-carboxybiuret hydrolase subunit AtzG-like
MIRKPARSRAIQKRKTSRVRAAKSTRAKSRPPSPLEDFVDAAARALDLPLETAWKPAIKANLEVTLRLAALFADFPLPDDAEPAPVFRA